MDIPSELVTRPGRQTTSLSDVKEELNTALDQQGYYERSYYAVPDGFAMATASNNSMLMEPLRNHRAVGPPRKGSWWFILLERVRTGPFHG